ncbi:hypothetical protein ACWEPN_27410 [Nonomuraea wenchangensis]
MHLPAITRRLTVLCATLLLTAGLAVSQATTATAADSLTDLNLGDVQGSGDTAAAGGKVFIAMEDRIVVTDTQGGLTGSINNLAEPRGLAASTDGTRLYATLRGSNEVAEIDTATLGIIRRIDVAAHPCPDQLALSGHTLWVAHGCYAGLTGGALSLDMSAATPVPQPVPLEHAFYSSPQVAAAGNTLVMAYANALLVYELQGGAPSLRGRIDSSDHQHWNGWGEVALSPDGATAYVSPGAFNDLEAWDMTSLTLTRSYGKEEGVYLYGTMAVSADGSRVAVSRSGPLEGPIVLFDTATGERTEVFYANVDGILQGSLTFSGTDLFAVAEAWPNVRHSYLWRMHGALLPVCKLTLTGPAETRKYSTTTFTGRLTEPDGSDPAVRQLTVSFREMGEVTTLPGVTTNADGTFTFTHAPYGSGNLTYIVYRENTPDTRSCTASTRVYVQSW